MKRVMQEDPTGCGLACVAMIVGAPYKMVRKQAHEILPHWPAGHSTLYTDVTHLKALLKAYDIHYGNYRQANAWSQIKAKLSIAAINLRKNGNWHWVVLVQDNGDAYLLDPHAKQEKRRDFGRAKLHAYLPIKTC